ncbi:MAG: hypothetical protein VB035_01495 [Candidatus Fimivivens sp.]|nr:hypothetical protein [Candidatus Fimivivens sp.]
MAWLCGAAAFGGQLYDSVLCACGIMAQSNVATDDWDNGVISCRYIMVAVGDCFALAYLTMFEEIRKRRNILHGFC